MCFQKLQVWVMGRIKESENPSMDSELHDKPKKRWYSGALKTGAYIVSPYFLSKKDANPFRDTRKPLQAITRYFTRRKNSFDTLDEVIEDNPEFEKVRKYALKRLKAKRMLFILILLVWGGYYAFYGDFSLFNIKLLDSLLSMMYSGFIVSYLVVIDIQYMVFKHRLLKLSLFSWMGLRIGAKQL